MLSCKLITAPTLSTDNGATHNGFLSIIRHWNSTYVCSASVPRPKHGPIHLLLISGGRWSESRLMNPPRHQLLILFHNTCVHASLVCCNSWVGSDFWSLAASYCTGGQPHLQGRIANTVICISSHQCFNSLITDERDERSGSLYSNPACRWIFICMELGYFHILIFNCLL